MTKRFKRLALILCLVVGMASYSGCGDRGDVSDSETVLEVHELETTSEQVTSTPEGSEEPSPVASQEEPEEQPEEKESHYVYNMRAVSSFVKNSGYENIEVYWNDFLDAVVEGRTSFQCPDMDTYRYVQMELIMWYLPGADEWIDLPDQPKFKDGTVSFSYKISDEEREEKLEQIKTVTESVLNEVFEDDYTDFEKAMALYLYFVNNYTYLEDMDSWGGIMRVLTKHYGICDEFSRAYSYLLVQAGVEDAGTVSDIGHKWSFIKIGENYYHVDTTWGLGHNNLSYFMMTTKQRMDTTGDRMEDVYMNLMREYQFGEIGFPSEDDTFSVFWNTDSKVEWNREEKMIYVRVPDHYNGRQVWRIHEVSYEGY